MLSAFLTGCGGSRRTSGRRPGRVGPLEGREVSAVAVLAPLDDVGEPALCPSPRDAGDLLREDRRCHRDLDHVGDVGVEDVVDLLELSQYSLADDAPVAVTQ